MDFIFKYKNYFIALVAILIFVGLYFIFKRKDSVNNTDNSGACPSSFVIRPGFGIGDFISTTYSSMNGKYYKQISGGAGGASAQLPPKEISEADFLGACKTYQSQPS